VSIFSRVSVVSIPQVVSIISIVFTSTSPIGFSITLRSTFVSILFIILDELPSNISLTEKIISEKKVLAKNRYNQNSTSIVKTIKKYFLVSL